MPWGLDQDIHYDFNRTYASALDDCIETRRKLLAQFDANEELNLAAQFADEELSADIVAARQKLSNTLDDRIERAKQKDAVTIQQIKLAYAKHLDDADAWLEGQLISIYDRAFSRYFDAWTAAEYRNLEKWYDLLGDYRDSQRYKIICSEQAEKLEKKERAKKRRRPIIIAICLVGVAVAAILAPILVNYVNHVIIPSKHYKHAEALLAEGDKAKAAIEFGKSGDYEDAKQRSFDIWGQTAIRNTIASRGNHTIGLRDDGTVVGAGDNEYGQCNVSDWTNIVAVVAGIQHTIGLRIDGTVVAIGANEYGQCNVSDWTDIVAVASYGRNTLGLKSDGTVMAVGNNTYGQCDVSEWADIVAVVAGGSFTVGLQSDGTVLATGSIIDYNGIFNDQYDVSDWSDIVTVAAGYDHIVGLQRDGTVVATGFNEYGQCDVADWVDIVAVAAGGDYTVGLRSDGTVITTGGNTDIY